MTEQLGKPALNAGDSGALGGKRASAFRLLLIAAISGTAFTLAGCSEAPPPEGWREPVNAVSSEAQAAEPERKQPQPVGRDIVSVGEGIWRMCDGTRMIYFHTSYKHAAIVVVTGQQECQP